MRITICYKSEDVHAVNKFYDRVKSIAEITFFSIPDTWASLVEVEKDLSDPSSEAILTLTAKYYDPFRSADTTMQTEEEIKEL